MKEYSKNQGITLIALIVSIIVMLVLAGTTIAMLTGREGIYYRSDDAVHDTEKGKDMELIRMAYSVVKTSKLYVDEDKSAVTAQELEEALKTEENNENVKVVEKWYFRNNNAKWLQI